MTLMLCVIVFLTDGCCTVTPNMVKASESSYDASTPKQYDPKNSGLLFATFDSTGRVDGAVITSNAKEFWNRLIADYRIQFKSEHKVDLVKDAGVVAWKDQYGNALWRIDAEHLSYFEMLGMWRQSRRDSDSAWQRAKELITPL